jgi:hypothetical protein
MIIEAIVSRILLLCGFGHHTSSGGRLTYWVSDVRPGVQEEGDPIIFVHGIGIGKCQKTKSALCAIV